MQSGERQAKRSLMRRLGHNPRQQSKGRVGMEYTEEQKRMRRAALLRIDLNKLYNACNNRYFEGKLPHSSKLTIRWVTSDEIREEMGGMMMEGAHWNFRDREINFRLSGVVSGQYNLLRTMVHEMIHVHFSLVENQLIDVKRTKSGKQLLVHHGEHFGTHARRINKVAGFRLLSPIECNYGLPKEHPERVYRDEYAWDLTNWAVYYDHETHLRKKTAKKEEERLRDIFFEWEEMIDEEMMQVAQHGDFIDGEWVSTKYYDDVWFEHVMGVTFDQWEKESHKQERERERERVAQLLREKKAQAKAAKAAAFKQRMASRPIGKQIESLKNQLANPLTPRGFIKGLKAELAVLEQQVKGDNHDK